MRVFEFLKAGASTEVNYSIPKTDFKILRRVANHENANVSDVLRAIIRSFMFEYRQYEARGENLPEGWFSHEPPGAKMVGVKSCFPEKEIVELNRIATYEGARMGIRLTAPGVTRAVLRAFANAQVKADAENRPIESADLFSDAVGNRKNNRMSA